MSENSVGTPSEISESARQQQEDRISILPNDLIGHILSLLPLHEAVATSVLSKNWRWKWTLVYNLFIADADRTGRQFKHFELDMSTDLIDKIYLHVGNAIKKIDLMLVYQYDPDGIKSWVTSLLRQGVEVLTLVIMQIDFILSSGLVDVSRLTSLTLQLNSFSVCAENHFPNLTSLHLSDVEILIGNGNTNDTMKFTLPVLETLRLSRCTWSDVKCVEITAPLLKNFYSEINFGEDVSQHRIDIHATTLALFQTCGGLQEKFLLTGSVIKAEMINYDVKELRQLSGLRLRDVFKVLYSSLEHLMLSAYLVQAILESSRQGYPLPTFHKLERLHICDDMESACNPETLIELLHVSPSLKFLILRLEHWKDYNYDVIERVPSCMLSCLEVVSVVISAKSPDHFDLLKFILKNGAKLRKFCYENRPWAKVDGIMEQLSALPRASMDVRIMEL